jgi:gamma-glutamyltranspeptidase
MPEKFSTFATNGMVVSSQPLATLAGVWVLMDGANAIDAADGDGCGARSGYSQADI